MRLAGAHRGSREIALSTSRLVAATVAAVLVGWAPPSVAQPEPEVTCAGCVVVDASGEVVWGLRPREPRPNASTTKIATALAVVDRAGLDEEVVVSEEAAGTPGGLFELQAGQRYEVRELLEALLMASSNDAAVALAEHVAGSEAAFVEDMNALAAELGAASARFVTAHGLDAPGHASSPLDLATLARALLRDPVLAEVVAATGATIEGSEAPQQVENSNPLLTTYRGAIGVKTGMTALAGDVLVAAAERGGRTFVAVAMGSSDAAADAAELLDYAFAATPRSTVVVRAGQVVGELVLDPAGSTGLATERPVRGPAGASPRAHVDLDRLLPDELQPGVAVGTATFVWRGRAVGTSPLVVTDAPEEGGSLVAEAIEWVLGVVHAAGRSVGAF